MPAHGKPRKHVTTENNGREPALQKRKHFLPWGAENHYGGFSHDTALFFMLPQQLITLSPETILSTVRTQSPHWAVENMALALLAPARWATIPGWECSRMGRKEHSSHSQDCCYGCQSDSGLKRSVPGIFNSGLGPKVDVFSGGLMMEEGKL